MATNDDTPATVQNGHEEASEAPAAKKPYFEVAKDAKGTWHWCLWSANGRMLATNAVQYERRNDCTKAIQSMLDALKEKVNVLVRSE